ncbi:hypothetical protein [Sphingobacterium sp. IITKGP-BTPF85]|uniref:hypothetical protein n=1 Tax=Sphingobacterium sp. IITKGP-BTPF85 TaxID=1338009 RepID=UPI000389EBC3|nr:hypothetical protein [Sphingobacterium sp. IITKGP-BTPF85]KKX47009.1 hypothetical protein L950_0228760 [Sphingobacterium sp. IITKGP-BTPF85]
MSVLKEKYQTSDGYKYSAATTGRDEDFKYAIRPYNLLDYFWSQYKNSYDETENRLLTSATLNWDVVNHLKLRGRIGNDFTSAAITNKQYNEHATRYNSTTNSSGGFSTSKGLYSILYGDVLATYANKINSDWDYSVSAGFQSREENYDDQSSTTQSGLVKENWFSISNSYAPATTGNERKKKIKYAYFGMANIGYKGFAYLDGTYRSEYSSTMPPGNNNYKYGSVSGSLYLVTLWAGSLRISILENCVFPTVLSEMMPEFMSQMSQTVKMQ